MLSTERVTNIDREVVRYDPLVIGTVNDVYKRMARAVGRIDQKVRNGEHLNDIETALFVGWDITKDGICLLTDRETVNPAFPLPANLQTDKFLATYKNPDTGEEYKAPTRLPVEYMIFYLDAEIAAAEGELIGVRGKKRQEIWDKINARLKEREVLKGNSVLLTEEQASLVTDAIHREAYLIGSNPVRTQEDDVKNHLKGEKIITKERRGLKLAPVDGNYVAPWDELTWKDLEAAFGKKMRSPRVDMNDIRTVSFDTTEEARERRRKIGCWPILIPLAALALCGLVQLASCMEKRAIVPAPASSTPEPTVTVGPVLGPAVSEKRPTNSSLGDAEYRLTFINDPEFLRELERLTGKPFPKEALEALREVEEKEATTGQTIQAGSESLERAFVLTAGYLGPDTFGKYYKAYLARVQELNPGTDLFNEGETIKTETRVSDKHVLSDFMFDARGLALPSQLDIQGLLKQITNS